jgi:hypothetical protein
MINQICAAAGVGCLVIAGALVHPALGWFTGGALALAVSIGNVVLESRRKREDASKT